jgi:hypothetical protein
MGLPAAKSGTRNRSTELQPNIACPPESFLLRADEVIE